MNPWIEGILGTVIAALIIALFSLFLAAIRSGVNGLRANTAAITEFRQAMAALQDDLKEWRSEARAADEQISARVADLETWRTAVTASVFRAVAANQAGP